MAPKDIQPWVDDVLDSLEFVMAPAMRSATAMQCFTALKLSSLLQDEVAPKDIQPWVDDALDSLEFAMGPANSTWGKVRAAMGREEPWVVPFFAIGNEVSTPESELSMAPSACAEPF